MSAVVMVPNVDVPRGCEPLWRLLNAERDFHTNTVTRSRGYYAERLGKSEREVSRDTAALAEVGLIAHEAGGHRGMVNVWTLIPWLDSAAERSAALVRGAVSRAGTKARAGFLAAQRARHKATEQRFIAQLRAQRERDRVARSAGLERVTDPSSPKTRDNYLGSGDALGSTLYGGHTRFEDARAAAQRDLDALVAANPDSWT